MNYFKLALASQPKYMQDFILIMQIQFNVHGSVHRNNILIYVQQDATLHSLSYLETALHVLGGISTHHQEGKQLMMGGDTTQNM